MLMVGHGIPHAYFSMWDKHRVHIWSQCIYIHIFVHKVNVYFGDQGSLANVNLPSILALRTERKTLYPSIPQLLRTGVGSFRCRELPYYDGKAYPLLNVCFLTLFSQYRRNSLGSHRPVIFYVLTCGESSRNIISINNNKPHRKK